MDDSKISVPWLLTSVFICAKVFEIEPVASWWWVSVFIPIYISIVLGLMVGIIEGLRK